MYLVVEVPTCLLKCDHEEADGRTMFYINHTVTVECFQKIVVASLILIYLSIQYIISIDEFMLIFHNYGWCLAREEAIMLFQYMTLWKN